MFGKNFGFGKAQKMLFGKYSQKSKNFGQYMHIHTQVAIIFGKIIFFPKKLPSQDFRWKDV
jgi:hypothetical protein